MATEQKYIYGPVFSRRLGRSLGVDLIPFKTCAYDCIYCQLGRTTSKTIERKNYADIDEILCEIEGFLSAGIKADYISLAGSGEPTLHSDIGSLVNKLGEITDVPIAVLTNGSLLWMDEVKEALAQADLVLPSLDAGDDCLFRYVNRPHSAIDFQTMVDGLADFTDLFHGEVHLEVLLLDGVTGIESEIRKIDEMIRLIQPAKVQLNTASRPPAEDYAFMLTAEQLNRLARYFSHNVEVICDNEHETIAPLNARSAAESEIISLLRRRSSTINGIASGLNLHSGEIIKILKELEKKELINKIRRKGKVYYEIVNI